VNRLRRRTLINQLIGRQVALLAILLFVVGVSQYLILRAVLFASTAQTLGNEIAVLTPVVHHTLANRGIAGFSHIADIMVARLRSPGVEVVITNALGQVIAASTTLHAKLPPLYNSPYFIWNQRLVVNRVIGNVYYPSGYVWLLSSTRPIHSILSHDAVLYVFLAVLSLIVAGWLGSLSVRQTLHPLEQIRQMTQRIASGEFGHATRIDNAPAELQDLGESIDRMSESIQALFSQEKALSEQMRRFVADASHELRTPLTAITGFLDLMSHGELTPEEQERGLRAIQAQGRRMGRLVNQLLMLSRMDSAPESHLTLQPIRLDRWLADLSPEIDHLVHPRPVSITAAPVTAHVDPDRLTQVLTNLLENIRAYTPDHTEVRIIVQMEQDWIVMRVEDNGPGIPPEDLPYVFDRFYRGDRARTSQSGGSGLGLSIAQSLIEAHHGTIRAEAVVPHGSRFVITLPVAH
jgi:two-component system OmpR family sensor kinase